MQPDVEFVYELNLCLQVNVSLNPINSSLNLFLFVMVCEFASSWLLSICLTNDLHALVAFTSISQYKHQSGLFNINLNKVELRQHNRENKNKREEDVMAWHV